MDEPKENTWIFGYGSLLWNPAFPFIKKQKGYIKGWHRRFYQGSTDHRGVPGNPGRVVTVIPHHQDSASCTSENCFAYGVAYQIAPDKYDEVISYLDFREKGGYIISLINVHSHEFPDQAPFKALLYTATIQNPEYLVGYHTSTLLLIRFIYRVQQKMPS
eukprot:TRINITY_DN760_c0_g1_i3.p1 TRINITY_DN760_c0_g1~~TRINITY_DN760_c0_g1_i3.p1  ORF type:complete len:177 (-),score=2.76 TRINITY_DN760_c0_g1_i3:183-662(-)